MQPNAQGFDEYLGFLSGASLYLEADDPDVRRTRCRTSIRSTSSCGRTSPFAVRKDGGPRFAPDAYMTDYLAREAARAIEANRNRPFFLYLAFNAPHTPLQALRSDYDALSRHRGPHAARLRGDDPRARPRRRHACSTRCARTGSSENTLVIFTSDNGGADYVGLPDINKPYRGWKMTFFEGGVHTPFFAQWPARLAAGQRYRRAGRARRHLRDRGRRRGRAAAVATARSTASTS